MTFYIDQNFKDTPCSKIDSLEHYLIFCVAVFQVNIVELTKHLRENSWS